MFKISTLTEPTPLPRRHADCHKGDFGAVGILGGAVGMAGAAILAGRGALLCGAGRVYVGMLDGRVGFDPATPEMMVTSPEQVLRLPPPACLVAGPGMGASGGARQWLEQALGVEHALLLDADALNLISQDAGLRENVQRRHGPTLLTPHPGEAARLLGVATAAVQKDREGAVKRLADLYAATVILKGMGTLIHQAGGKVWHNITGNPGMAAPGMGDVLAGIIAALVAQGLDSEQAAVTGVWVHGTAGDHAAEAGRGPVGLTASEVAINARVVLNGVEFNASNGAV